MKHKIHSLSAIFSRYRNMHYKLVNGISWEEINWKKVVNDNCWLELIINKKKKQQKQMAYLGTKDLIKH